MNCNVWAVTSKRGVVYISCVAGKRLISATLACLFGLWIYLFTAYKLLLSWHQAIAERYLWVKEFITQVINLYIIGAVPVVYIWHSRMAFFSKVMRLLEQFVRLRHFRAVQCVQLYLLIFKFWKKKNNFVFQDEFDSMRPLCYPGTDIFLVCFSVVRPTSLWNIRDKWLPEIKRHLPKVPILLVGTQIDLRENLDILVDLARLRY